jgi:hypothetical protein
VADTWARTSSAESEMLAPEQSSLCRAAACHGMLVGVTDGLVSACRPYYRASLLQKGPRLAVLAAIRNSLLPAGTRFPPHAIRNNENHVVVFRSVRHVLTFSGCHGPTELSNSVRPWCSGSSARARWLVGGKALSTPAPIAFRMQTGVSLGHFEHPPQPL